LLFGTDICTTPTATDGDTATESDVLATETETETEGESHCETHEVVTSKSGTFTPPKRISSTVERKKVQGQRISQHDLLNKYFRRDTVLLHNVDLLR
jgi:phosphatidylethanolamine N-methyltransferase